MQHTGALPSPGIFGERRVKPFRVVPATGHSQDAPAGTLSIITSQAKGYSPRHKVQTGMKAICKHIFIIA